MHRIHTIETESLIILAVRISLSYCASRLLKHRGYNGRTQRTQLREPENCRSGSLKGQEIEYADREYSSYSIVFMQQDTYFTDSKRGKRY